MKKISIVTSCFNEEDNISILYKKLLAIIDNLPRYEFEIIFIDNASTDFTQDELKKYLTYLVYDKNKTLFAKLNLSYKELKDKIDPFDPNRNKITFSSRYSGPKWEDDFIDLDALINNVVRDCVKDAKEVE